MVEFIFSYPTWYLAFCFLLAGLGAFLLYFKDKHLIEINGAWKVLLGTFRFIGLFILLFLLLKPLVESSTKTVEKPIIVIAQDNSRSVLLSKDSSYYKTQYTKGLNDLIEKLNDKYEVRTFSFGTELSDTIDYDFSEKITDFSVLLEALEAKFYSRNLGAIVIASDGIVNKGSNPLYEIKPFKNSSVFTIAMGDTIKKKDLIIDQLVHNKIAYLGNEFPVEAIVKANFYKGKTVKVKILNQGKLLSEKSLEVLSNQDVLTIPFIVSAEQSGLQKFTIQVEEMEDEFTYINNTKSFYIEVLDSKQKVLIVQAGAHPDVGALKKTLSKNLNFEIEVINSDESASALEEYNLVILHQVPSILRNDKQWLLSAKEKKIPYLLMIDGLSNYNLINSNSVGVQLIGANGVTDASPVVNEGFKAFTVDDAFSELLNKVPPVQVPFVSSYKSANSFNVFLHQKIGSTKTDFPLIGFNLLNGYKNGVIIGEGMWRWKFQNHIIKNSTALFSDAMLKMVQYLAQKENKDKFRLNYEDLFLENEEVVIQSSFYNDIYELINTPEVIFNYSNEDGDDYPQKSFNRVGEAYRVALGKLPPGNYTFTAQTAYNGEKYAKTGEFMVKEIQLEYENTLADHKLLYELASNNGGAMVYPDEVSQLYNLIAENNNVTGVSYTKKSVEDIITWKWIFFLILSLFTIEWFLRKRNGAY